MTQQQPSKRGRPRLDSRPDFRKHLTGILPMVQEGKPWQEVADVLGISARSLKRYIKSRKGDGPTTIDIPFLDAMTAVETDKEVEAMILEQFDAASTA